MHNFNKVRKMFGGGSQPSPYRYGQFSWTDKTPSQFFGLQGNNNLEGSNNAIEGDNNVSSKAELYTQILNALGGVASVGSNVINQDMYYTDGWNKAGQVVNSLSGIPILGPVAQIAKFGVNSIAKGLGTEMDNFDFDKDIAERHGGSYSGWLTNANKAKSISGKTALGKAFREGSNTINNAQIQTKTIAAIDKNAQNAYARAANTQLNHMQYETTLNGGFDPRYMAIAKLGIKLENLNRLQTYKTKQIINVNTKQIEEFKNGGSIGEEFTPTIIEEPWVPEIILDVFKDGGKTEESEELIKLKETNQKNVIPEGALHKNKHHIENTDSLTQKGIPVIDNEGEQQAEIELNEIIFTLEVTKKLEELHKLYKEGSNKERDEAAIEAGKLLVQEILYNTDDRTGLIAKCEKGGKL